MKGRTRISITVFLALSLVVFPIPAVAAGPESLIHAQVAPLQVIPQRHAGLDRYATAVEIARAAYPGWVGLEHVMIAAGDAGMVDGLSASGLCWTYDAPLLLVSEKRIPQVVLSALAEIRSVATTLAVHVVGGESRISADHLALLESVVGIGNVDRIAGSDRFETAREVALRMSSVAHATGRSLPQVALLANGAEEARFVDALVLSALTAARGAPLLLLRRTEVPEATALTLGELGLDTRYVAGGTACVTDAVVESLGATRLAGADRYATARAVAREGVALGWLDSTIVGLAASMPDALAGASLMGRLGGPMLLTTTTEVPKQTAETLREQATVSARVFGGPAAVSNEVVAQLQGAPAVPRMIAGGLTGTSYVGPKLPLSASVGVNASRVSIFINGRLAYARNVEPYTVVSMGTQSMSLGTNTISMVVESSAGTTRETRMTRRHLGYTWNTYIVVDKSDFRLYWVRNGVLESIYPVAIGKPGWETPCRVWRIDAKYYTNPASVYGPRKMRLYRKVGTNSYSFTAYGIHGTNEPWVIGTKASHGCIRMYNADVLELFPKVPLHTMTVTRE